MSNTYRFLALSDHWIARLVRKLHRIATHVTLPAPRLVAMPMLWTFLALRSLVYLGKRVLICEPILKAYCKKYGSRLRADIYIPWIQGQGDLILGNDVWIDGRLGIGFAARFSEHPRLVIGDRTSIGHNSTFTVGKHITIGRDCHIASDVWMFDSSGHPTDPAARLAGLPTLAEDVRPIFIGDNVWIGRRCIIFPGVSIGEGSVVSAGSVVMTDVGPNTMVAGNPARKIAVLAAQRTGIGEIQSYG